jgi:flagellar protein FlbD
MILITRLNHHPFVVNSDWIKFVEQAPDTVITLLNGEKIVVLETAAQVIDRVVEFRRRILQGLDCKNSWVLPQAAAPTDPPEE